MGARHGNYAETHMYLNDISGDGEDVILSSNDMTDCDFTEVEVILYIGCSTAAGYTNSSCRNLLNRSVDEAGCAIAVGFSSTINCSNANEMAELFVKKYFLSLNCEYEDYEELTEEESRIARLACFIEAINDAACDSGLNSSCVYYTQGVFYQCTNQVGT